MRIVGEDGQARHGAAAGEHPVVGAIPAIVLRSLDRFGRPGRRRGIVRQAQIRHGERARGVVGIAADEFGGPLRPDQRLEGGTPRFLEGIAEQVERDRLVDEHGVGRDPGFRIEHENLEFGRRYEAGRPITAFTPSA